MQFWDPLEATLDQLRVKFWQIWTQNEPNWGHIGPIFNQLGTNLGILGAILATISDVLDPFRHSWGM